MTTQKDCKECGDEASRYIVFAGSMERHAMCEDCAEAHEMSGAVDVNAPMDAYTN